MSVGKEFVAHFESFLSNERRLSVVAAMPPRDLLALTALRCALGAQFWQPGRHAPILRRHLEILGSR
jgi:hypothetical protein